jgi:hypothetical protein
MENFDLLDEHGNRTGEKISSTIAHLTGARHASVEVLFFDTRGRILLQHRDPMIAIFPSRWTFTATGHVSSGAESRDAAIAEIEEEISASDTCFIPDPRNLIRVGAENFFDGMLLLYEVIFISAAERGQMEFAIHKLTDAGGESPIDRILIDVHESANTLMAFAFNRAMREPLGRAIHEVESACGVRFGVMTDNVEKKNLFLYRLEESEIETIEGISRRLDEGERSSEGYQTRFKWSSLESVVGDFHRNPEKYSDAFMPYLKMPELVAEISRIISG